MGYSVRLEAKRSPKTRLLFCTIGEAWQQAPRALEISGRGIDCLAWTSWGRVTRSVVGAVESTGREGPSSKGRDSGGQRRALRHLTREGARGLPCSPPQESSFGDSWETRSCLGRLTWLWMRSMNEALRATCCFSCSGTSQSRDPTSRSSSCLQPQMLGFLPVTSKRRVVVVSASQHPPRIHLAASARDLAPCHLSSFLGFLRGSFSLHCRRRNWQSAVSTSQALPTRSASSIWKTSSKGPALLLAGLK